MQEAVKKSYPLAVSLGIWVLGSFAHYRYLIDGKALVPVLIMAGAVTFAIYAVSLAYERLDTDGNITSVARRLLLPLLVASAAYATFAVIAFSGSMRRAYRSIDFPGDIGRVIRNLARDGDITIWVATTIALCGPLIVHYIWSVWRIYRARQQSGNTPH